ncbi:SLC13 family permease [Cylindrospermopsis raciborskii DSH]|uniref:SLC13 family permease n=1 Tax=Cylindrospermopsis raciborskii TaxID=77022 RepID=UPI002EDA54F0
MENWQAVVSVITFVAVILAITVELLDLTVAALLGALVLVFTNIMSLGEAVGYIGKSHSTLGLFFGVMVLVRSFEPTNIFSYIATQIVILAQGSGRKLLLGIVLLVTPICAFLPNATTVMLLAPLIPPMAEEIGVNFVPLLILMVFVANSSGLLTLVGDPATFIVGDAVNISFIDYLTQLSLGGAIAVITVVVTLPILFRKIWRTNLENLAELPHPQINHPRVLTHIPHPQLSGREITEIKIKVSIKINIESEKSIRETVNQQRKYQNLLIKKAAIKPRPDR